MTNKQMNKKPITNNQKINKTIKNLILLIYLLF